MPWFRGQFYFSHPAAALYEPELEQRQTQEVTVPVSIVHDSKYFWIVRRLYGRGDHGACNAVGHKNVARLDAQGCLSMDADYARARGLAI